MSNHMEVESRILSQSDSRWEKSYRALEEAKNAFSDIVRKRGTKIAVIIAIGASLIFAPQEHIPPFGPGVPPLEPPIPPGEYLTHGGGGWEIPRGPGEEPIYVEHFDRYVQTTREGWVSTGYAPNGEPYAPFVWFCVEACSIPPKSK